MHRRASVGFIVLLGCGETSEAPPPVEATVPAPIEVTARTLISVDDALAELELVLEFGAWLDRAFERRIERDPEWASSLGLPERFPDATAWLEDLSPAFVAETDRLEDGLREQLRRFENLTGRDAVMAEVLATWLDQRARLRPFRIQEFLVTHIVTGAQVQLARTFDGLHPFNTAEDAERYVLRLRQVGSKMAQIRAEVARRANAGYVLPVRLLDSAVAVTRFYADASPLSSGFHRAFASGTLALEGRGLLKPEQRTAMLQEAERIIGAQVRPAYSALATELQALRARAPAEVGVGRQTDGAAYYTETLRLHTTTASSAEEIHQLGQDLLRGIHAEMRIKFERQGLDPQASLAQLYEAIAEPSQLFTGTAIVAEYERILREAEARLPEVFETLPQAPWRVIGGATGGFYIAASLDGSRPGAFYAQNTGTVPGFGMPTLAYHEAVPGHHLQIALAQESGLPLFASVVRFTAATEGWALYAERLAAELGWYAIDPLGDLGRLQFEAFRAARLVVDTGIHAKGWTFAEAASYFAEATGFTRSAAEGQIARYAVWPGQSTAYMMGMQAILRLRERAQARLGSEFDLKRFHTELLNDGAIPLDILEREIERWLSP